MIRTLLSVVRPQWGLTLLVLGLLAMSAVLDSVGLSLFIPLVGTLTYGEQAVGPAEVGIFAYYFQWLEGFSVAQRLQLVTVALVAALFLKNVLNYLGRWMTLWLEFWATRQLRLRVFAAYLGADYGVFLERKQGRIVNDVLQETSVVGKALTCLLQLLSSLIGLLPLLVVLALISWPMTLVALGGLVALTLGVQRLAAGSKKQGATRQELVRHIVALTTEGISGIRQIKILSIEPLLLERFADLARRINRINSRLQALVTLAQPVNETLVVLALGAFFLVLSSGAIGELHIVLPMALGFVLVVSRLLPGVASVSTWLVTLKSYRASVMVIEELLALRPVQRAARGGRPCLGLREGLAFEEVTFSYPNAPAVLHDVNVVIPKGTTTAIVGPSGAGKSTIVDLIARLYQPTTGRVTVDGIDLQEYDVASWRRAIGFVSQETFIFNTSIRDNIAFASPDASDEDIRWAAEQADAQEFIQRLPQGYETVVGDRGLKLSGGQRQRIAIARAMVRRPPILIFDEATSSLDHESEQRIQQAMERLSRDRTVIVVAHRLSTVIRADQLIIVDNGHVVEQGTHHELMQRGRWYWKLYRADGLAGEGENRQAVGGGLLRVDGCA